MAIFQLLTKQYKLCASARSGASGGLNKDINSNTTVLALIPQMISRHIPTLIISNKLDGLALNMWSASLYKSWPNSAVPQSVQ